MDQEAKPVMVVAGKVPGLDYLVSLGPGKLYTPHRPTEYYDEHPDIGKAWLKNIYNDTYKRMCNRLAETVDGRWHKLPLDPYWADVTHVSSARRRVRKWAEENNCYVNFRMIPRVHDNIMYVLQRKRNSA